jgi:serine/threonine-protein kinase RsbW
VGRHFLPMTPGAVSRPAGRPTTRERDVSRDLLSDRTTVDALKQYFTIEQGFEELAGVLCGVDRFCKTIGASQSDAHALLLSIEEVITNVLHHGYQGAPHPVSLVLEAMPPDRVRAVVTDAAPAYDPLARPDVNTNLPLEERPIGGLGVHLVKSLMTSTHYEWRDGKNVLSLELVLKGARG